MAATLEQVQRLGITYILVKHFEFVELFFSIEYLFV